MNKIMPRQRGESPGVNAGSMADIAFLLLIFFLVTTTIDIDKGIPVKLPPYSEIPPETQAMRKRNVYRVVVNANNQLLVRDEQMDIKALKENAMRFISNNGKDPELSVSPKNAIISLQNDRGTNYETYLTVYNELKAAYSALWDDYSMLKYQRLFKDLDGEQQKIVKTDIPLVISEADPTDYSKK